MTKAKKPAKKKALKNKLIDLEFLKTVTGDDTEFEKELFLLFLDSAKNNISKMEKALTDADNNAWYASSHAFKGAAASIGAFNLSKSLEYAQTHPKDDYKDKIRVLTEIKEEFSRVSDYLNQEFLQGENK